MSETVETCPAPDQLRELLKGGLSNDESEMISKHLESCSQCQNATQSMTFSDTLLELVRQSGRISPAETPTVVSRVIENIRNSAGALSSLRSTTLRNASGERMTDGESRLDSIDEDVTELLTNIRPAEKPDELGRLGEFRLLTLLGYGGMGAVFLAEDLKLERTVALKLLRTNVLRSRDGKERFFREARSAANVKHENVVTIYQVGEENGIAFLAQELLEGETLDAKLAREGQLPVLEAIGLAQQIASGLAAAHARGLVHRDIKPANVFLSTNEKSSGGLSKVKLLDFGLARSFEGPTSLTQSGLIVGTPGYMSPEQAAGDPVDHRSDLFSLGCVLYVILTGRRPFADGNVLKSLSSLVHDLPPSVRSLRSEVSEELSRFVDQLLSKSPSDRLPSADIIALRLAEFRSAIVNHQGPPEETIRQIAPVNQPPRPPRTKWTRMIGPSALILIFGLIIIITNKKGEKKEIPVEDGSTIQITNVAEAGSTPSGKNMNPHEKASRPVETKVTDSPLPITQKSAAPLPDQPMPFAIFRDGQLVDQFPYFPVELAEHRDGDVIEVRGNGLFRLPQINLTDRGLHLRAAAGYQPVFVPADSVRADQPWIVVHKGTLRLEGCEFRRVSNDEHNILMAMGDECEIVNCTLIRGASNSATLAWCDCPKVRVADSLLISGFSHVALIFGPGVQQSVVENSVYLCSAYVFFAFSTSDGPRSCRLERNTFAGQGVLLGGQISDLNTPPGKTPLEVIARHNLFACGDQVPILNPGVNMTVDDYRPRLSWQGEGNVSRQFDGHKIIEQLSEPKSAGLITDPELLVQAQTPWDPNSSIANRLKSFQKAVTAAPAGDNQSVGPKWELVGPGAGYLQTLGPDERSRPDRPEALSGGPFTLVRNDVTLNGYTSFADAMIAAQDNDVIELRTDHALVARLDQSIPGRRVTIRSGKGYQPKYLDVSQLQAAKDHEWQFINLTLRGPAGKFPDCRIRRLQNCTLTFPEARPYPLEQLLLQSHQGGTDIEIENCVLPGITTIDVTHGRKVIIRNSVLQTCYFGGPMSVEKDQRLVLEDSVIGNPMNIFRLIAVEGNQRDLSVTANRTIFAGGVILLGNVDRVKWSGDNNQYQIWSHVWNWESVSKKYAPDFASWQKRWSSDEHSIEAPSPMFDPREWRLISGGSPDSSTVGVDFSRFSRPMALK